MKIRLLNGNVLKIIAAITMLIDHMGLLLFPQLRIFRIIGRLSMPLFAFLIAEGCRYTRNKARHLALIAVLSVVYSAVYYIVYGYIYLSIFSTFTFSILMIYALQNFKKCAFGKGSVLECVLSGLLFAGLVSFVYALNLVKTVGGKEFLIDYGFWGCMLPVFASLCDLKGIVRSDAWWTGCLYLRLFFFVFGIAFLCLKLGTTVSYAYYAFLALLPLSLYNEKKGKLNLKYFFYVFYPVHMGILFLIQTILSGGFQNLF